MKLNALLAISLTCALLALQVVAVFGQEQLVVLKKEDVLQRFYVGDEFVYKPKDSKVVRTTYVRGLPGDAVITHRDTVPFHRIDRIYFRQHKFYNTVGAALVVFGGGLFLIDQFNEVVVNGRGPSLDDNVSRLSAGALIAGLPMMLIKKKSQKIRHPVRLMTVRRGSIFYERDTRKRIE